jgi:peroxiredoxin family protein
MATTEDRVVAPPLDATVDAPEPNLTDLLGRIEALEDAQRGAVPQANKLTIIAWGGELDRIWPTTILATTAAASGMESMVFFTFWGLFAIVKPGVRITGDNWIQKMMSAMNPGSAQKAKLSHYNFAGAGPAMFKKLADDHRVAKPEELIATAQDLGARLIPCQMTMDLLGLRREDLLDGLEEPIGAATALAEMRNAAVSLFI